VIRYLSDASGDVLVYPAGTRLYINLTNRCTARCVFCRRETFPVADGYNLRLAREHSAPEYIQAISDPKSYEEIVFCGYGEPTLRLAELSEIARAVKEQGGRVRLNTNGHGNRIHGRNIVPELQPFLDEISISVNAPEPVTYARIVRPDFGASTFGAVMEFVKECVGRIARVTVTAVNLPGLDLDACGCLARALGADFKVREFQFPDASESGLHIPYR
jgi:TatD DNase family protein